MRKYVQKNFTNEQSLMHDGCRQEMMCYMSHPNHHYYLIRLGLLSSPALAELAVWMKISNHIAFHDLRNRVVSLILSSHLIFSRALVAQRQARTYSLAT